MTTSVQFTGTLSANQPQRWSTFNWPTAWHAVWYTAKVRSSTFGATVQPAASPDRVAGGADADAL